MKETTIKTPQGNKVKANIITREKWESTHKDFKGIRENGIKSMTFNENGMTVSRPVVFADEVKAVNTINIQTSGTHLQGYIPATLGDITEAFGSPRMPEGGKTRYQWDIEFADNLVATIYDYKDLAEDYQDIELDPEDEYEWHIGGTQPAVVQRIQTIINNS